MKRDPTPDMGDLEAMPGHLPSPQFVRFGSALRKAGNDPIRNLPNEIERKVIELRQQWQFVGAAFQRGDDHCKDCGYCASFEGAPGESLTECVLGHRPHQLPTDCPALQAHIEALRDEQEFSA